MVKKWESIDNRSGDEGRELTTAWKRRRAECRTPCSVLTENPLSDSGRSLERAEITSTCTWTNGSAPLDTLKTIEISTTYWQKTKKNQMVEVSASTQYYVVPRKLWKGSERWCNLDAHHDLSELIISFETRPQRDINHSYICSSVIKLFSSPKYKRKYAHSVVSVVQTTWRLQLISNLLIPMFPFFHNDCHCPDDTKYFHHAKSWFPVSKSIHFKSAGNSKHSIQHKCLYSNYR